MNGRIRMMSWCDSASGLLKPEIATGNLSRKELSWVNDLVGGGLVRSVGGWSAVKQLRRENAVSKGDERILGDGNFVEAVLAHATESLNRKHHLRNINLDLETIIQRIGDLLGITREEVLAAGKNPRTVHARSLLCYFAVEALGIA
jgi:hypothetical protein